MSQEKRVCHKKCGGEVFHIHTKSAIDKYVLEADYNFEEIGNTGKYKKIYHIEIWGDETRIEEKHDDKIVCDKCKEVIIIEDNPPYKFVIIK